MRKQRGFSLIELLIVVAIILIIAAIAIPNLLRARIAANESAAASTVRTLNTAEVSYITAYPASNYGVLAVLGGIIPCTPLPATACLIDNTLATDNGGNGKSGYHADVLTPAAGQYVATENPIAIGSTGVNSFCSIEDAVVRKDVTGVKDAYGACGPLPSLGN
jgi:prepilin-type N-terminal cleavage/methylation domain-containing protein